MGHDLVPSRQRKNAKSMRRAMTDAELKLWNELRAHRLMGISFRRQVPIGPYIVDFACSGHRLIVEVDGSQHADAEHSRHDEARSAYLSASGWTILRFWNDDVIRDIDNVCQHIVIAAGLAGGRRAGTSEGGSSMIDHLGISVSDFEKSKAFYDKAMAPLGASLLYMVPEEYTGGAKVGGYGRERPVFWMSAGKEKPKDRQHVAFTARSRAEVDAFHAAALAAGGRDNGGPGLRPHYHPNYYGAFVFDPDGNNVEAVCHDPE